MSADHEQDIEADVKQAVAAVANGHKPMTVPLAEWPDAEVIDIREYLKHFGITTGQ
jgi:hypothetical protein